MSRFFLENIHASREALEDERKVHETHYLRDHLFSTFAKFSEKLT